METPITKYQYVGLYTKILTHSTKTLILKLSDQAWGAVYLTAKKYLDVAHPGIQCNIFSVTNNTAANTIKKDNSWRNKRVKECLCVNGMRVTVYLRSENTDGCRDRTIIFIADETDTDKMTYCLVETLYT